MNAPKTVNTTIGRVRVTADPVYIEDTVTRFRVESCFKAAYWGRWTSKKLRCELEKLELTRVQVDHQVDRLERVRRIDARHFEGGKAA